ncbi:hypothetical protein IWX84_000744 [Flavobacterium sp. CG_9.10]|nr:hypothetical protein [Flavobacterium sp. CG_9.10]
MQKIIVYLYKNFIDLLHSGCNPLIVFARFIWIKLFYGKKMLLHQKVTIKGLKNIESNGLLRIGTSFVGFVHKND